MMRNDTKLSDDGRLLSGAVQGFNMESVLQRVQQCGAALDQEVCSGRTQTYGLAEVRQMPPLIVSSIQSALNGSVLSSW